MDPTGALEQTQAAVAMALQRGSLDFQANMSATLINGTLQKGAEMEQAMRGALLAKEGIGQNINIVA